ncbi:MAG: sulfatase-like hydrolase/transferase [Planctomycetota bacterium]
MDRHLTTLVACLVLASTAVAGEPNILFCIADDWGWPHAGAYGDPVVQTPTFDRVAAEGVLFEHAYVSSPSCTPSRNAILTGQHFWRLGAGANLWSWLDVEHPTYPLLLEQAGYHVGRWRKSWGPGRIALGGYDGSHPAGTEYRGGFDEFLAARPDGAPFCFWLGASDPHRGYERGSGRASGMDLDAIALPGFFPDVEEVRSDVADYYFEVQRFDRDVGRALARLEELGELERTIVVVTGDHGMPFPRCKTNLYDHGVRVPLALRWGAEVRPTGAGRAAAGSVSAFVSLVDLAPTFLEAADVALPDALTGRSLLPLLFPEAGRPQVDRSYVVFGRERHTAGRPGAAGYPARGIRTARWAYLRNGAPERWPAGDPPIFADCDPAGGRGQGLTKGAILALEHSDEERRFFEWSFGKRPAEELYDVLADPDQLRNVAADPGYAEDKARLAARLDAELAATGDPRSSGDWSELDAFPYFGGGVWKPTVGHANGIKIGEVTDTSAVLWTRLTRHDQALARIDAWDPLRPHWRVPGAEGEVRFAYWKVDAPDAVSTTDWIDATASTDFCAQVRVEGLSPATAYALEAQGRAGEAGPSCSFAGSFTTAPAPGADEAVRFVVSSCQDFPRRDDPDDGHRIYRSMLALDPAFFVQTGDTIYYDKPAPFAKDVATARYKWNRMYALPRLVTFHAEVPSYWMHDDHDVLRDDCWPGQSYGELTFETGIRIWREQVPQSERPFRTFRWGEHLQIWLPEGREFRTPNREPDGAGKSILGAEQWAWLERSLSASDAAFKIYVSATPVVGPDRPSKNDNHANAGFASEGERLRALLEATPGCFVVNGDRHWQYHSIDPETGLQEFGCGASSDAHAGGFRRDRQEPWQPFLRIAGGFASVEVAASAAVVRHHDVDGNVVHEVTIAAPR